MDPNERSAKSRPSALLNAACSNPTKWLINFFGMVLRLTPVPFPHNTPKRHRLDLFYCCSCDVAALFLRFDVTYKHAHSHTPRAHTHMLSTHAHAQVSKRHAFFHMPPDFTSKHVAESAEEMLQLCVQERLFMSPIDAVYCTQVDR